MKIVAIPRDGGRASARYGDEDFGRIDYTAPPKAPRRRRRRPEEDVGNPSTIFPKAPTFPAYVAERNPHGTEYVRKLVERIDSGLFPHELDERRSSAEVVDIDAEATSVMRAAS